MKTLARFVAIGMVSGSFFVGYKWTKQQAAHASSSPVHPESRQSALRLMDEAVRAKHEGRLKDALQAAADARRANPKVAGADVIAADIALVQRDAERSRAAAAQALELGQDVARAKLLLALSRLIPGGSRADAGEQPAVLLEEAGEAEFSDPDVRYVMSELLRASGREKEAREKLLGNLYRQEPWMSATIIAAKLQLAAFEANRAGEARARVVPTAAGDALVAAHGALRSGGDLLAPLRKLWASIAAHQVKEFLDDPLFDVPAPPSSLEEARKAQPPPIPYLAEE